MVNKIVFEANPKSRDLEILNQGLAQHAAQQKGHEPLESVAFFVRNDQQQIKGGLYANLYYGCLDIDMLWLDVSLRGQDYGTQLIQAAEQFAIKKGCLFASVSTMDWEALDFYKKLGYHVELERRGFLKNSILYFLRKDF